MVPPLFSLIHYLGVKLRSQSRSIDRSDPVRGYDAEEVHAVPLSLVVCLGVLVAI